MKDSFLKWKLNLNRLCEIEFEVSLDDLPKFNFTDWFKVGLRIETALEMIREEIRMMIY